MNSSQHSPQKLVSLILASNRPHQMQKFLDNVQQTVADPASVEVLVKIDEGDETMRQLLDEAAAKYLFDVRYIQTPKLDGYYTLHLGYQQLFEKSHPDSYFFSVLSEEVRFQTQGWDVALRKYVKFFDDDLFRLKISRLKYRYYYSFHDCGPTPENFPFITRKWLELSGGIGDCWGPDGWHQYIDYHLGLTEGVDGIPGNFRSVAIHDIQIGGEEAGLSLTPEQSAIRAHRIYQEWWRMYRTEAQQGFRRLAVRMAAYIWAKHEKIKHFEIIENKPSAKFTIIDTDANKRVKVMYYYVSPFHIRVNNFFFLVKMVQYKSDGFIHAFLNPSYGPATGLKKIVNKVKRHLAFFVAKSISEYCPRSDSIPYRSM
jgi:hypothetical protein